MFNFRDPIFLRRLRLYLFGVILGLISVYFMFGARGCEKLTSGMLYLDKLSEQRIIYSDTALCLMKCEHITPAEVKESFTYGKINTPKSTMGVRYPLTNFEGQTRSGRNLTVICLQMDSLTRIIYVNDRAMKKDSCPCR